VLCRRRWAMGTGEAIAWLAKLLARSPSQPRPPLDDDQESQSRIRKLVVETEKLELERDKLARDLVRDRALHRLEWFRASSGFGPLVAAIGVVATLAWSMHTFSVDSERKVAERVSALLKDFGSKEAQIRASAAISLGPYVADPAAGATVVESLAFQLSLETEFQVRRAIVQTLILGKQLSLPPLTSVRNRIAAEIRPLFTDLQRAERRAAQAPNRADIANEARDLLMHIRRRQDAVVAAVLALRDLQTCPPPKRRCPADFSELPLKGFSFGGHRADLQGAVFRGTVLWGADLFLAELEGADFSDALLMAADLREANLAGAVFRNARLERFITSDGLFAPARFAGSNLKGAVFDGACLGGADFSGARGLSVEQFKRASTVGASFDQKLFEALQQGGGMTTEGKCRDFKESASP
jgi:Pentapeptide repeats (8 copies)